MKKNGIELLGDLDTDLNALEMIAEQLTDKKQKDEVDRLLVSMRSIKSDLVRCIK